MRYDVRPATLDDVPGIQAAYLRAWRAAYSGHLAPEVVDEQAELRRGFAWQDGIRSTSAAVLVAVDDAGAVVGVVQVDESLPAPRDLPEITMLYVDPRAWGTGTATSLLAGGTGWLSGRLHRAARLRVVEEHVRARRFYEREGWSPDQDVAPARNAWSRLVYYRRALT